MLKAFIANQRKVLRLYSVGAILFFVGVALIQYADQLIEPSIEQEIVALLGILTGGSGFLVALTAQLFLIIDRFQRLGGNSKRD